MFKLFTFLFHTFPLILAWLYLLVAIFCVVVHIKQIKSKAKIPIGQCAFSVLNVGYVLFFLVTRIFFPDLWEQTFAVLGLLAIFISFIWSRYEDRCAGRRWWNW